MKVFCPATVLAGVFTVQFGLGAEAFSARPPLSVATGTPKPVDRDEPIFNDFAAFIKQQQASIIETLEAEEGPDGARFRKDEWTRGESSGATCVLEGGRFLEKAAVSVSIVKGTLSEERAATMTSRGRSVSGGAAYCAAALSLVLHSGNPLLPTFRSDVRYFEAQGRGWFGGGADLTPYYLNHQDITEFHDHYKALCDRYECGLFDQYKRWCDEYFYLPARQEHRGVGGIFFDDLEGLGEGGPGAALSFTKDVARSFMPSYLPIVHRRAHQHYTPEQRDWMLVRRGRYLEFNLLYDRGVKFGLSGGRVESVLVSAPPLVAWRYDPPAPAPGSAEAELLAVLKQPREWASSSSSTQEGGGSQEDSSGSTAAASSQ